MCDSEVFTCLCVRRSITLVLFFSFLSFANQLEMKLYKPKTAYRCCYANIKICQRAESESF